VVLYNAKKGLGLGSDEELGTTGIREKGFRSGTAGAKRAGGVVGQTLAGKGLLIQNLSPHKKGIRTSTQKGTSQTAFKWMAGLGATAHQKSKTTTRGNLVDP